VGRRFGVEIPDRPNLSQGYKLFALLQHRFASSRVTLTLCRGDRPIKSLHPSA